MFSLEKCSYDKEKTKRHVTGVRHFCFIRSYFFLVCVLPVVMPLLSGAYCGQFFKGFTGRY